MSKDAPLIASQNMDSLNVPLRGIESSDDIGHNSSSLEPAALDGVKMSSRSAIAIAVDPAALIITECVTVTSAMRKHVKWAHSSVSAILGGSASPMNSSFQISRPGTPRDEAGSRKGGYKSLRGGSGAADGGDVEGLANRWGLRGKRGKSIQDNPLIAGFGRLRAELTGCKGMQELFFCSSYSDFGRYTPV